MDRPLEGLLPISVVIPCYGRHELLSSLLKSYIEQQPAEIIIVDDAWPVPFEIPSGCADGTSVDVRVVRNADRLQQPLSRMVGVAAASQQLIFFGEDDVFLQSGLLAALYSGLEDLSADIVAGPIVTTTGFTVWEDALRPACELDESLDLRSLTFDGARRPTQPIPTPILHSIALMRRHVIESVGFDEMYRGNGFREEADFYLRSFASGFKVFFLDAPVCMHYKGSAGLAGGQHAPGLARGLVRYETWVAINNYYFLRKNRAILLGLGRRGRPLAGTLSLMLGRSRGYPGRLRFSFVQARRSRGASARRAGHS